jgi:hypothetical protein
MCTLVGCQAKHSQSTSFACGRPVKPFRDNSAPCKSLAGVPPGSHRPCRMYLSLESSSSARSSVWSTLRLGTILPYQPTLSGPKIELWPSARTRLCNFFDCAMRLLSGSSPRTNAAQAKCTTECYQVLSTNPSGTLVRTLFRCTWCTIALAVRRSTSICVAALMSGCTPPNVGWR